MQVISRRDEAAEKYILWDVAIESDGERILARYEKETREPMLWTCTSSRPLRYNEASALLTLCCHGQACLDPGPGMDFEVRNLVRVPGFSLHVTKFEAWRALETDVLAWSDTGEKVGIRKHLAITPPVVVPPPTARQGCLLRETDAP